MNFYAYIYFELTQVMHNKIELTIMNDKNNFLSIKRIFSRL